MPSILITKVKMIGLVEMETMETMILGYDSNSQVKLTASLIYRNYGSANVIFK